MVACFLVLMSSQLISSFRLFFISVCVSVASGQSVVMSEYLLVKTVRPRPISTTCSASGESSISQGGIKPSSEHAVVKVIENDLKSLHGDIRLLFVTKRPELKEISDYFFDGSGKSVRPLIICSMARALNFHSGLVSKDMVLPGAHSNRVDASLDNQPGSGSILLDSQRKIGMIAEMIHVSSLIHDDIIDNSEMRRGKATVHAKWGCNKAVLAGDYILAEASSTLARLGNTEVVTSISQILEDLVQGELMQFGSKETENERFEHYTAKTYRKTASLIANSCKAVAQLLVAHNKAFNHQSSPQKMLVDDQELVNMAFECGKNIGIAFQLIDDLLDFTSHSEQLGKPGFGADLRLGLATAPVLFAASQHPSLNAMIMRRFKNKNDVQTAFELVMKSDGIRETRFLAAKYSENAENILKKLKPCSEVEYLRAQIRKMISREK